VMRTEIVAPVVSVFVTFVGPGLTQVSQLGVLVMMIAVMDPGNQILAFHYLITKISWVLKIIMISVNFYEKNVNFLEFSNFTTC